MEINGAKLKQIIVNNNEDELMNMLNSGLNPNFEGGWPIRLAARYGSYSIVKALIQFGANPHLLGESGKININNIFLSLCNYVILFWMPSLVAFVLF